ncbi:heterokaryon incompatibility protein-domain-containing protein [Cubamyces lactineus]|nr:heterokaryon incompatibility protein-domain-containing protein [Cubamyces lactineus]
MTLTHRTSRSVCPSCWHGPAAAQYGILADPLVEVPDSDGCSRWTGGYVYSVSPAALLFRACYGCAWCTILVRLCRTFGKQKGVDWPYRPLRVRIGNLFRECDLQDTWEAGTASFAVILNDIRMRRTFSIYTCADDPASSWLPERCASLSIANSGSLRALRQAKSAVDKCMREHDRCKATSMHPLGHATLPRRLVDCSDLTRPRLIETETGAQGTYVALSYVWGESQPHQTTTANMRTYMDGMDPVQLPQTIRDAIFVTRILGYRFLWVDSLCIVQDSVEDKHRELRAMRNVYREAVLTIDAASAAKVSDGFLQARQPLLSAEALPFISPCSIQGQKDSSIRIGTIYLARARICVRARDSVVTTNNPCGCQWETRPDPGQTGRRAWCLQEGIMSCRSLVFTTNAVQLRCQTATQTVGGTYHATVLDPTRLPDLLLSPHLRRAREDYSASELTQVHEAWRSIVQDYTRRALSEPSDKLVACAGLAEEFARVLRSEYLAGLWRDSLLRTCYGFAPPGISLAPCIVRRRGLGLRRTERQRGSQVIRRICWRP